MSSPLVRKKAINIVSKSESDNEYDSLYSSLLNDKEILDCLLNLFCISSNKKREKTHKMQKTHDSKNTDTSRHCCHQNHCHHNVTVEQCYLNLSEDMVEDNPLDLENIKERQDEDDKLTQSVKHPTWYSCKTINNVEDTLCYTKPGDNAANWKIALPEDLIVPTIKWYHQVTDHP